MRIKSDTTLSSSSTRSFISSEVNKKLSGVQKRKKNKEKLEKKIKLLCSVSKLDSFFTISSSNPVPMHNLLTIRLLNSINSLEKCFLALLWKDILVRLNRMRCSAYEKLGKKFDFLTKPNRLEPHNIRDKARNLEAFYTGDLEGNLQNECIPLRAHFPLTENLEGTSFLSLKRYKIIMEKMSFGYLSKRGNILPDAIVYTRVKLLSRKFVFSGKENE
uniref:Uncharacterized protein n=1 Tax=Timema poppense TaxID=170557 RepID=A0A7R9DEM1_TIMPO|nr:unnamed protein product [Timema poppensis]